MKFNVAKKGNTFLQARKAPRSCCGVKPKPSPPKNIRFGFELFYN